MNSMQIECTLKSAFKKESRGQPIADTMLGILHFLVLEWASLKLPNFESQKEQKEYFTFI